MKPHELAAWIALGVILFHACEHDAGAQEPAICQAPPEAKRILQHYVVWQDPTTGEWLYRVHRKDASAACIADLNGDGTVGGPDFTLLQQAWGQRCERLVEDSPASPENPVE